ncbi:MAG TPA: hypothetical protein VGE57_14170 [Solimonas sp.]
MFKRVLLTSLLLGSLAVSATVQARPVKDVLSGNLTASGSVTADAMLPSHPRLGPEEAAREIQRRHGGRVLSVQSDGAGYRVKMLKSGEVRIFQINP